MQIAIIIKDIYVCTIKKTGEWAQPILLVAKLRNAKSTLSKVAFSGNTAEGQVVITYKFLVEDAFFSEWNYMTKLLSKYF